MDDLCGSSMLADLPPELTSQLSVARRLVPNDGESILIEVMGDCSGEHLEPLSMDQLAVGFFRKTQVTPEPGLIVRLIAGLKRKNLISSIEGRRGIYCLDAGGYEHYKNNLGR